MTNYFEERIAFEVFMTSNTNILILWRSKWDNKNDKIKMMNYFEKHIAFEVFITSNTNILILWRSKWEKQIKDKSTKNILN
jgi:hypothetical protein